MKKLKDGRQQKKAKQILGAEHAFIYLSISGRETATKSHRATAKRFIRRLSCDYLGIEEQTKNAKNEDITKFYFLLKGNPDELKKNAFFTSGTCLFKSASGENAETVERFFLYPRQAENVIYSKASQECQSDKRKNNGRTKKRTADGGNTPSKKRAVKTADTPHKKSTKKDGEKN